MRLRCLPINVIIFVFSGLTVFVMFIWGGLEIILKAGDQKAQDAGKQRMSAAVVGFLLLFSIFWIAQIMQIVLKVNILGN